MTKKHQISIVTALPTKKQKEFGYSPFPLTKGFRDGKKASFRFNKYFKQEVFEWDNLQQLYYKLKPYIQGITADSYYSALMYGSFIDGTETPYGYQRTNQNVEDNFAKYLMLDIETCSPQFEEVCLDLAKVQKWMVETYPWIHEDTGMLLYQTASAGVVMKDGSEKHKQIRVRAILELEVNPGLNESQRKSVLRPWMNSTLGADFYRHIDNCTHQKARLFYLAPPVLDNTERLINVTDIVRLKEGLPVSYSDISEYRETLPPVEGDSVLGVLSPKASPNRSIQQRVKLRDLKEKEPQHWFKQIGDGNRYHGIYNLFVSAHFRDEIEEWKLKLIRDKQKLGDKTHENLKHIIRYIENNIPKSFDKPQDSFVRHNNIELEDYLLKDCETKIEWKDKGVILQKLYEGAGKTQSLKELREIAKNSGKSFLYIAPNEKPVVTACEDLDLTCYQDIKGEVAYTDKDGLPRYPHLGICYPSLKEFEGSGLNAIKRIKWDIIVMDEIEQLLLFAITDNREIIQNPFLINSILSRLVEKAELVVGLDARISDITLMALEELRTEPIFDLYQQSTIEPWQQHEIIMVDGLERTLQHIIEAVKDGKRVAVTSELDRSGKLNIENLMKYVEEITGVKGWAVDRDNKNSGVSNIYMNDLGHVVKGQKVELGALEKDLIDGKISHIWASPVLQSAWSYLSDEAPFDLVVGIYPNSVLTAPNIVQHISRFRKTKNFVMYINEIPKWKPWELYAKMHPPISKEDEETLGLGEFNARKKLADLYDELAISLRKHHFIEIAIKRGASVTYDQDYIINTDEKLGEWLKAHHEKAWDLVRSRKLWLKYNQLKTKDAQELEVLKDIIDFENAKGGLDNV